MNTVTDRPQIAPRRWKATTASRSSGPGGAAGSASSCSESRRSASAQATHSGSPARRATDSQKSRPVSTGQGVILESNRQRAPEDKVPALQPGVIDPDGRWPQRLGSAAPSALFRSSARRHPRPRYCWACASPGRRRLRRRARLPPGRPRRPCWSRLEWWPASPDPAAHGHGSERLPPSSVSTVRSHSVPSLYGRADPKASTPRRRAYGRLGTTLCDRPRQGRANVAVLKLQPIEPHRLLRCPAARPGRARRTRGCTPRVVLAPVQLSSLMQALLPVRPQGLEDPVARLPRRLSQAMSDLSTSRHSRPATSRHLPGPDTPTRRRQVKPPTKTEAASKNRASSSLSIE